MPTSTHADYVAGNYLPGKWEKIADYVRRGRDRYVCHDCKGPGWQVHHMHYRLLFREEQDMSCLITLCDKCHRSRHGLNCMMRIERMLEQELY
jgi:hypothetical protein